MVELLLRHHHTATNAAAVSVALQAVLGIGTATAGDDSALQYDQHSLVDDGISVTHIASRGGHLDVRLNPSPDMIVIVVRTGQLQLTERDETVLLQSGELGLISLDQPAEAHWDEVTMDLFSFPRASLGHLLGSDAEQLRFDVTRVKAVSPVIVKLWKRTAATLTNEILQTRELFESDIIRERAIDALLSVSIETFGISDLREDHLVDDHAITRQAITYMQDHISEPMSVPDIANAVGLSLRGLQLAFRRTGQGTALMHLRALRMTTARDTFTRAAGNRSVTVGGTARSLGYTNLGRFSAHYREAFNETPTETLRVATEAAPREGSETR